MKKRFSQFTLLSLLLSAATGAFAQGGPGPTAPIQTKQKTKVHSKTSPRESQESSDRFADYLQKHRKNLRKVESSDSSRATPQNTAISSNWLMSVKKNLKSGDRLVNTLPAPASSERESSEIEKIRIALRPVAERVSRSEQKRSEERAATKAGSLKKEQQKEEAPNPILQSQEQSRGPTTPASKASESEETILSVTPVKTTPLVTQPSSIKKAPTLFSPPSSSKGEKAVPAKRSVVSPSEKSGKELSAKKLETTIKTDLSKAPSTQPAPSSSKTAAPAAQAHTQEVEQRLLELSTAFLKLEGEPNTSENRELMVQRLRAESLDRDINPDQSIAGQIHYLKAELDKA